MSKFSNPTMVVTGLCTFSYLHCWEPKAQSDGGKPKYSVMLLIPKSDTRTVEKIKAAIQAAYEEGQFRLKGNSKSVPALADIHTPLHDGDLKENGGNIYKGCWFLNARSDSRPGVVDSDRQDILDRSEMYSGVVGRASLNFYAYNNNGNKGIGAGLNHLQKIADGVPLGGRTRAQDDFAIDEDEDFLD